MLLGCLRRELPIVGQTKFNQFIDILKNMSAVVVQLIENDYFASNERVELAHVMSWMLGCTEYGLLRTSGMEVGYYDRLDDKYCSYLRQDFPKSSDKQETRTPLEFFWVRRRHLQTLANSSLFQPG